MDWLKDKKNIPFILAGAGLLIIGSIAYLLYQNGVFTPSNPTPAVSSAPMATAYPGGPPGIGGPAGAVPPPPPTVASVSVHRLLRRPRVGAPGAAPVAKKVANFDGTSPIDPATVNDPFQVPLFSNKQAMAKNGNAALSALPPLRSILPTHDIYTGVSAEQQASAVTSPAAPALPRGVSPSPYEIAALPRVSGVLTGDGVYAIIQTPYGDSQSVKPGDIISGVGSVTSIQSDGITVKTNAGGTVHIPVTAGSPTNTGYPGMGGPPMMGGYPGMGGPPMMGGYPGMGGPPMMGGYPGPEYNPDAGGPPPPGVGG